jgi:hypothetical protein
MTLRLARCLERSTLIAQGVSSGFTPIGWFWHEVPSATIAMHGVLGGASDRITARRFERGSRDIARSSRHESR